MSDINAVKNYGSTPETHDKYLEGDSDFAGFEDSTGVESTGGDNFGMDDGGRRLDSLESDGGTSGVTDDTTANDPWNLDNLGSSGQDNSSLKDQIKELLKNPNLTPEQKKRLEKMEASLSLAVNPEKAAESIAEDFETLKEEIEMVSLHGAGALRLSQALGMEDIGEAAKLLDKYGIDPDSKNIDMEKLKKLLMDPQVAGLFAEKQDAAKGAQKTLNGMVSEKETAVHTANQAIDQKPDTSNVMDYDFAPAKWLYDTQRGESKEAKDLSDAANGCSQQMADFISQVFKVDAVADPKNPGMVNIPSGGGSLNAVDPTMAGPAIKMPEMEQIPIHLDLEGDGQNTVPDWLKKSTWPVETTDNDGIFPFFTPFTTPGMMRYEAGDGHGKEGGLAFSDQFREPSGIVNS